MALEEDGIMTLDHALVLLSRMEAVANCAVALRKSIKDTISERVGLSLSLY